MEGKKSEMYSRAAKMREGEWSQVGIAMPEAPIPIESRMVTELPEVIIPSMPLPITAFVQEPAMEECGYCITPAMAYVPMQKWGHIYEAEMGMERGTLFPELDLPFLGGTCNDD